MEEKLSAAGILELFVNASTVEMNLGMENGEVEDEYWGRKYLQVEMSRGIFDLSLCRIREIRGCLDGYGNCSHDNQEIVQVI